MDTLDVFRQLTAGVRFTKKTTKKKETQNAAANELKRGSSTFLLKNNNINEKLIKSNNNAAQHMEQDSVAFEYLSGGDCVAAKHKKKKLITAAEREKLLEQEQINLLRKEQRISVLGKNVPPPLVSFDELQSRYNVSEQLVQNILSFNYTQPTPIQMQAIPIMLAGRPLMACAPTGSGKTMAFLTPIINDLRAPKKVGFRALVLAPTRELAQQIYRECVRLSEKTALHIHFISKVSEAKQKLGPESSQKFDILISTPNRVRYLLNQEPPLLDLKSVEWFVLDEGDRLMEEGQNNFKEQLDDILAACTNPQKKLALFSATYTAPVGRWALKNLKNLARVTVGQQNAATDTVQQELLYVGCESGKLLEIRNLVQAGLQPPVLIFVQSKERAKQLFEELIYDGVNVDIIHADRTQQQRDNCVRAFREGHVWVLICTELMGRGIDFKGVNLVINFDFPPTVISYIHRIGRTGRAGRPGRAITFYTQNDLPYMRSIAQIVKNSGGNVPEHLLTMKKLRKTETRRLANFGLKREEISTKLQLNKQTEDTTTTTPPPSKRMQNSEKLLKKRLAKTKDAADAKNVQKKLKKLHKSVEQRKDQNKNASSKKKKTKTKD